ncbi:MAG: aminoglycoside phosphotransferase family protein [Bdellovibrionales bacterium]|nr:aminoglycoside phosphotransferase family protein [Bdellovibrionales bacterium]
MESIQVDKEGWVNPCFFVDGRYAVRFNARDPNLPKFQRENRVFDLLRESKVPVPPKVILDDSKEVIEYDVLISSLLEGENLEANWKNISPESQIKIAFHAGQLLRQIHDVSFDFFGEITRQGPLPQTDNWFSYLNSKLEFHLGEADPFDLFSDEIKNKIWSVFEAYTQELNKVKSSRLIHVDFHFGNLLFLDDEVSGVLDFEWSFAGDPLYDVSRWLGNEEICNGSHIPFLEGYGFSGLNESESSRIKVYQMIKNIELCPVAKEHFGEDEVKEYLDITIKQIDSLFDDIKK